MNRFLPLHRHHSIEVPHEEATLQQQSAITFRGANNLILQLLPPSTTFPDRLTLEQPRLCGAEVQSRKSTIENRSFRLTFYDQEYSAMQYTAQCGMLCRLSQLHGLYTMFDVTNALQEQLGEDDPDANCKLLVTTTTGNPIKDMVTTRGKVFAGALPKETHCSCTNKRNYRGIILPPNKCVYAEYCSKKNIGS